MSTLRSWCHHMVSSRNSRKYLMEILCCSLNGRGAWNFLFSSLILLDCILVECSMDVQTQCGHKYSTEFYAIDPVSLHSTFPHKTFDPTLKIR